MEKNMKTRKVGWLVLKNEKLNVLHPEALFCGKDTVKGLFNLFFFL